MRALRSRLPPIALAALAIASAPDSRGDEPNVVSLTGSALKKAEGGDFAGAAIDLTKAIELAPSSASLRYERARCRAKTGDVAGTETDLRDAARLEPAEYALDLPLWRAALEESRLRGGAKEPQVALVEAEVAAIRQRPFANPVASGAKTASDVAAFVDAVVDTPPAADAALDRSSGLARLGLLPGSFDVKKESARTLLSQVAGYYDPREKKFFVVQTGLPPQTIEATAAHELVHALQDQRFDLTKWFAENTAKSPGVRDDDRAMALRCVAEGEATFVQTVWQIERTTKNVAAESRRLARERLAEIASLEPATIVRLARAESQQAAPGSTAQGSAADLARVEPYVLIPFLTAYIDGANFVAAASATKDGWAAVDRLFTSPPETMEQCLHPEKWLETPDHPSQIELPALAEIAASGWVASDTAVHGEMYLRALLLRQGADAKSAKKGSAGWDGDVYRAWRKDGMAAIVLATTWDSVRDAQEFFDAYRAGLPKKYAKLAEERGSDLSAIRYSYGDAALGTGALILRDREVFAVEGFDAALRETVVAALTAMKVERVE